MHARPVGVRVFGLSIWLAQSLLALSFVLGGLMKLTWPMHDLVQHLPWTASVGAASVRLLGVSELLGGVGVILPSVLRVLPRVTWAAAGALVALMCSAAVFHVTRGEWGALIQNGVLAFLAAFVLWARVAKSPIASRSPGSSRRLARESAKRRSPVRRAERASQPSIAR